MSRKRNSHGRKARDFGSSGGGGLSKHRSSGKSQVNRRQRTIDCRDRNQTEQERQEARVRRRETYETVEDLMQARER